MKVKGSGKTGGRKKGSVNIITKNMKEWIAQMIDDNRLQFEANLRTLEPAQHVAAIEKLMSYIVAKPQNVDISMEYRHLETLLERTPEKYIEQITLKLIELNSKNSDNE